ncbi:MAG TPA: hypothetical protein VLG09_06010 [Candidatus Saccharimonadales bacterium]|nr:hypothetical protein [Candidatus Saccharimonadales bacterium]
MSKIDRYEFISPVAPTEENAISVQRLTLQDVLEGGFNNPTDLADPNNPDKVSEQRERLSQQPDQYNGYLDENGLLVAYAKSGEWRVGDELPFVEGALARSALKVAGKLRGNSLNPRAHGVFGLVVGESLPTRDREVIIHDLLSRAIGQAAVVSAATVNIVLREGDIVAPIAQELDFVPQGPFAEAAGAPGLMQRRYQRHLN